VATISITSPIVRICLSKLHIAVVFEHGVNLYRHQPRLEKLATYETTSNALGLCCLGVWGLAFPGRTPGQIQLVNLNTLKVDIIPAHTSPLKALALSRDGEVVATASDHVSAFIDSLIGNVLSGTYREPWSVSSHQEVARVWESYGEV